MRSFAFAAIVFSGAISPPALFPLGYTVETALGLQSRSAPSLRRSDSLEISAALAKALGNAATISSER